MTTINKNQNTPPLRFPEFTGEWKKKKLGEVIIEGKLGGNYENSEGHLGLPVIKMGNINRGEISLEKVQYLPENEKFDEGDLLKDGDLLFNTRNTLELVGKVAIWRNELPIALYNSNLMRITLNNEFEKTNRFLNAFFNTKKSINQLRSFATGTTSVAAIYGRDLHNFELSFPSLPEQQRIASFLTAVDEKITRLKQKKTLLEQYKKGMMQKLFPSAGSGQVPMLRFKDDKGKAFPKWEMKKGGDLFETISNKEHNSDLPILAISQDLGAVPREMVNYQISVTDKSVESYKVVEIGDFIISLRSFQGGIEYSNYKGICSPAYVILRNIKPINNNFFKYYFKTKFYIQRLCEKLEGIRDGKMISYKYFSEIELPFPSLPEQEKIATFLSSIDEKINHTQTQLEKTEAWKKGLLQKMFV